MNAIVYLDILVAALLVATVAYAAVLNRKLNRLRTDRSGFEKLLASFTDATSRAEAGVARLQQVANASAAELDSRRDTAVGLRDDLEFLVARAEEQANRLETLIAKGRDREQPRGGAADLMRHLQRETGAAREDDGDDGRRTADRTSHDHAGLFADADEDDGAAPGKPVPHWLVSARKLAASGAELR